jgi:hypothetical protein
MMIVYLNWQYLACVSQPSYIKKVASCVNYKVKLKQSNFEKNAKTIFSWPLSSQIRYTEKNCLLIVKYVILLSLGIRKTRKQIPQILVFCYELTSRQFSL